MSWYVLIIDGEFGKQVYHSANDAERAARVLEGADTKVFIHMIEPLGFRVYWPKEESARKGEAETSLAPAREVASETA